MHAGIVMGYIGVLLSKAAIWIRIHTINLSHMSENIFEQRKVFEKRF